MQAIAAEVGYSETAFAAPEGEAWRVRYFSPAMEVPFCGHATIALGAALAHRFGDRSFGLHLNDAVISVSGKRDGNTIAAALQSPPTPSAPLERRCGMRCWICSATPAAISTQNFRLRKSTAAPIMPCWRCIREALARMNYEFERGRALMAQAGLVTIALVTVETPQLFHVRNAFAAGGVSRIPPRVRPPPRSQVICATSAGRMAAPSTSSRAKTWAPLADPRRDRRGQGQLDPGLGHGAVHGRRLQNPLANRRGQLPVRQLICVKWPARCS